MDEIKVQAVTTKEEIATAVERHLTSESMIGIISENALDAFNSICDSKAPDIVDRIDATAKTVLKEDPWLKIHVEAIATKITSTEKSKVQEMVNQTVHSTATQRVIDGLAKTACNRHAAVATKNFKEVINEEDMTDATQTDNEEGAADATRTANHPAFADARRKAAEGQTEEEETELDEEAARGKKKTQKATEYVIFKSLNKFGQMDISSI